MHYLLELDTREIEYKSRNKKVLEKWLNANDLTLAYIIVSHVDDLIIKLSIAEMNDFYTNLMFEDSPSNIGLHNRLFKVIQSECNHLSEPKTAKR